MRNWSLRNLRVKSRHPSHSVLRRKNGGILVPVLACVRFGSLTEWSRRDPNTGRVYELNSVEAIKTSMNKLLMKEAFTENEVSTADWWTIREIEQQEEIPFPILAKLKFGSRGRGMVRINNQEELTNFLNRGETRTRDRYIFERYYNYVREYRLHVSKDGCFYACRKMLKSDTPEEQRWFRNDSNCVWYLEDNEAFDRPVNWNSIVQECVKALNAVGLDFGACDVRVQGSTNGDGERRESPKFIIVEINSAPSFGEVTAEKYKKELPKILKSKYSI